jgi:glycosyltransferase involved in cell wall biosynthesis
MRNGKEEPSAAFETGRTEDPLTLLISVVICTLNRADLLSLALRTACDQDLDSSYYEVIVVDNGSVDDTQEVVDGFVRKHPNVRYCREEKVGLSHSRNRGFREAKGIYIGYLDDDAKVPHNWLSTAQRIIKEKMPVAFGGPYYAFYNWPKPNWFKDEYGSREMAECARFLRPGENLSGGNLFIRREVLVQLGGFDPNLGMTGTTVAYGEETLLQQRILEMTPEAAIYYDPDLFIHHLVRSEKTSLTWRLVENFSRGRSIFRIEQDSRNANVGFFRALKHFFIALYYLTLNLTYGLLARDRDRFPFAANYLYEVGLSPIAGIGRFYELARTTLHRRAPETETNA